jgi:hypothetical protein
MEEAVGPIPTMSTKLTSHETVGLGSHVARLSHRLVSEVTDSAGDQV